MLTQEEYDAKRQARYDRLIAAAERTASQGESLRSQADSMASVIPFGQPILVGHYSEGRDCRYRSRIESKFRKGFELYERAQKLKERAISAEHNDAIYSDDPSAVDQLTAKIAKLEADQELWKKVNKVYAAYMKNPASLETADISATFKTIIKDFKPEWTKDTPIPSYRLKNNNANIRRLKERAQQVAKKQSLEDKQEQIGDVKIEYTPSENRIRIFYPGRVPLETFKALRQAGFRSLRTLGEGAFSAYYNNQALWFIKSNLKGDE